MSSELESEEIAHARSRSEADIEGIKLCGLLIAAFGYPLAAALWTKQPLDSAVTTCGLIAAAAAVLLVRELFERALAWRSRT